MQEKMLGINLLFKGTKNKTWILPICTPFLGLVQVQVSTSFFEGGKSSMTVQIVLIAWSFSTSEQQKKTLLHPLYLSNSHLI